MKYIKARNDLIFILNPLIMILGCLCFFYIPSIITHFFSAFWICTAIALLLIITPYGNHSLAKSPEDISTRLPWQQWIFCILLLEITLLGAYLGICAICGELFTINTTQQSSLFFTTQLHTLIHQGLFPWAFYAVISAGLGMLAYTKETNAYFSNLLYPFMKHTPQETGGLIVNISMRRGTMFGFSLLILFMSLLFITLLMSPQTHLILGFQPSALVTTLFLFVIALTKKSKVYIGRLFTRRIPTIIAFPIFAFAICFLTLFINIMSTGLVPSSQTSFKIPSIISEWIAFNWHTSWLIFSTLFWICLTAPVCGYITKVSKGYRIRHIMIGVLIFPACIAAFFGFSSMSLETLSFSPIFIKIFSCISFVILLPLLLNHQNSANAILAYFPKDGIGKPRDEKKFFEETTQLTIIFLYLYLVIGLNGLNVLICASLVLAPVILLLIVGVITYNLIFFKKGE